MSFLAPQFASLHGPLLSLNGSVAGSPVGLRPQYRPLSLGTFVDLALSGFERPFDQYFRQFHRFLRDFRALGRSWAALGRLLGALGRLLGALGRSWAALGRLLGALGWLLGGSWASVGRPRGPEEAPEAQDGPKGTAKRPQEQAPGRQLAPPRRDGKTSARSAHGKTSARSARETASPETPETREIYHETTTPRYRERLIFTATPPDHGKRERFTTRPPDTTDTATDVPFPQEHRSTENARDLPLSHQTNAAT